MTQDPRLENLLETITGLRRELGERDQQLDRLESRLGPARADR